MSVSSEIGVMHVTFPMREVSNGTLIEFGASTIDPQYSLQTGIFLNQATSEKTTYDIKVKQFDFDEPEVAFRGIGLSTATSLTTLLCNVVFGKITRQTYERELPLLAQADCVNN